MEYPPCPNPDRKALETLGARVRARLAGDPAVERIPVEAAEIWAVADFLSPAECDRLIGLVDAGARPSGLLTEGAGEGEGGIWRTSWSGDVDRADPFVMMIERRIDDLLGIPHDWGETIQGQRYEVGQEFREHMDWFWTKAGYWKDEARRGGQRAFTAMVYLSHVEAGGSTEFPKLGIAIPPQRGALIVWNNAGIDGSLNQATLHAGRPVERGVKHVITKWYRARKWG